MEVRCRFVANVEDVDDGDDAVDADDEAQHKSCFNWSELGCRCSTKVRSKKEIFLCISQISIVTLYVVKCGKHICIHIFFVPIVIP